MGSLVLLCEKRVTGKKHICFIARTALFFINKNKHKDEKRKQVFCLFLLLAVFFGD
jgi:hypothetical protein